MGDPLALISSGPPTFRRSTGKGTFDGKAGGSGWKAASVPCPSVT